MSEEDRPESTNAIRWVREHFAGCWRGERSISDAFWSSIIVYSAATIPIVCLNQYAKAARWPSDIQNLIPLLGSALVIFAVGWFTVSMWRSARRGFLLGQRFWPIVASIAAVLVAAASASIFVNALAYRLAAIG